MYRNNYVEVNVDKLCENVRNIVNTFKGYKYYIGVIKGNAYGYGEYIAKYIIDCGINYLAVSNLSEAINVRGYVPKNMGILCLEPIGLEYIDEVVANNITLCVSNMEYFNKLYEISREKKIKFHLKLNTGMNRLGISREEEVKLIYDRIINDKNLIFEGIFTHLATNGVYDSLYNEQVNRFRELVRNIDLSKIEIVHVFRSCTMDMFPKMDICNGVRVGIMMYGVGSTFPSKIGFRNKLRSIKYGLIRKYKHLPEPYKTPKIKPIQALSLKSEIIDIQKVDRCGHVGYYEYGWEMIHKDSYIGVIPLGYADGMQTRYSRWYVLINGKKYRVIGSVNMGLMQIIVDECVKVGDVVTVISKEDDYRIKARCLGVSPYVLLTSINRSIPRVYIRDGKIEKVVNDDERF